MRQGKVSEKGGDTWLFPQWDQGLTFPLLILRKIMPFFSMVAVNIAGWVYLIKMHIYMMTKLNICRILQ